MTECSPDTGVMKAEDVNTGHRRVFSGKSGVGLAQRYLAEKLDSAAAEVSRVVHYIVSRADISLGPVLYALKYVDRYLALSVTAGARGDEKHTEVLSPLEIVVAAFVLANKFLEDSYYSNKFWSETLNIPLSVINSIELKFLSVISFRLHVSDSEFLEWCTALTERWYPDRGSAARKRCKATAEPSPTSTSRHIGSGDGNPSSMQECACCQHSHKLYHQAKHPGYKAHSSVPTALSQCNLSRFIPLSLGTPAYDAGPAARAYDLHHPSDRRRLVPEKRSISALIEYQPCHYNPLVNLSGIQFSHPPPQPDAASRQLIAPGFATSFTSCPRTKPVCVNSIS